MNRISVLLARFKHKIYLTVIALTFSLTGVFAQTNPTTNAPVAPDSSKLKFMDKITHWLYAYGMSSPDFLDEERRDFKSKAFAEVYVEAIIDHDAWLFDLLNRITKFRYQAKQTPHIIFGVKLKPVDKNTMD